MREREAEARLKVLEQQMAVVARALELLIHCRHDDAAKEIAKIT